MKRRKNHHVRIADHFCSLVAEVGDASRNEIREEKYEEERIKRGEKMRCVRRRPEKKLEEKKNELLRERNEVDDDDGNKKRKRRGGHLWER